MVGSREDSTRRDFGRRRKTWKDAELQQAGFRESLYAVPFALDWDGGAASLQSRATDETGYLQPTGGRDAGGARPQLWLSQQSDQGLVCAGRWERVACCARRLSSLGWRCWASPRSARRADRQAGWRRQDQGHGHHGVPRRPRSSGGQRHRRQGQRHLQSEMRGVPQRSGPGTRRPIPCSGGRQGDASILPSR